MMLLFVLLVVLALSGLAWRTINPPPPKICGSPVTSPRVRLRDGRFLAYKELGVPKEKANHKLIITHGFNSTKDLYVPLSHEVLEEVDLCIITYDRAGYGESDPNPKRSPKTDAFDIQELADLLQLGPKFHVIGLSIATYSTWGCLKYIPHRLAGAVFIGPLINYWWASIEESKLCKESFRRLVGRDQWGLSIAHYAPTLFWVIQKWLPCSLMMPLGDFANKCSHTNDKSDKQIFHNMSNMPNPNQHKVQQQGVHESLYRDILVFYGKWEFDPTVLKNPFPEEEEESDYCNNIHVWQGSEDTIVPVELQRNIAQKLPWIQYHEIANAGHLIFHHAQCLETILRALLHPQKQ